jgi:hypothetical protein
VASLGLVADQVERCLVDLVGVGPDNRVRPAGDEGGAGVVQECGKPAARGFVAEDPALNAFVITFGGGFPATEAY